MIKFIKLIHKETGKIIDYSDWLQSLKTNEPIIFSDDKTGSWVYRPDYMVLTDEEFEIIYEEPNLDIICPYCNHKHEGLDYLETGDMDGDFSMICGECGKGFKVIFSTIIKFKTEI